MVVIYFSSLTAVDNQVIYPEVDFDHSMELNNGLGLNPKKDHEMVQFCRELYKKNNLARLRPEKQLLIPKIAHVIWIGPKKPPAVFTKCLESIKKFLPDWELWMWTDADIPGFNLVNKQYYDEEVNYGAKADILRYEILYRHGGVYFDVDFEILKSLDRLNYTYEFYTGLLPKKYKSVMANAIIGCVPGHPILKECVESIKDHRDRRRTVARTDPCIFRRHFIKLPKSMPMKELLPFQKAFFIR